MTDLPLLPHADADPVAWVGGRLVTAGELRSDVDAVAEALPPAPVRVLACRGRYTTTVALLSCVSRGEIALLPASHAPGALAALGLPVLHDGVGAGTDLRPLIGLGLPGVALRARSGVLVRVVTSGSTGAATVHDKTDAQLFREVDALAGLLDVTRGEVVLGTVPPHHLYGLLFTVLLPLRTGGVLVDDVPFLPDAVIAQAARSGATILVSVPAHLRALADADALPDVRVLTSSGAPLPPEVAARLSDRGLAATEVFGSTETGGIAWRRQSGPAGGAWSPLPGVSVSADVEGRILLDSPWLSHADPRPRPGDDRVEILPEGRFRHLGRLDDVVKIASRRVSRAGVEAALLAQPGVRDAAVVAVADDRAGTRLEALVVLEPPLTTSDLRAALLTPLEGVAVPRLHPVDTLPRGPNGKLAREELLKALGEAKGPVRRAVVVVPPEHPGFQGHFPGDPLLPGVSQILDLVLPAVRGAWPDLGALGEVRRLRFLAPVRPGARLELRLEREALLVRVAIAEGDLPVSSGTLFFR